MHTQACTNSQGKLTLTETVVAALSPSFYVLGAGGGGGAQP